MKTHCDHDVRKSTSAAATLSGTLGYRKIARFCTASQRILLVATLTLGIISTVTPDVLHADEQAYFEASDYVEVFDGDMPLVLAVGHGGWKRVGMENNGGYAADPLLQEYFYHILVKRIFEKTGHLPYVVYQQGNRNYVNTNQRVDSPDAYDPDNSEARAVYFEFHDQVDAMIARVEHRYGEDMALMIDPHSTDLRASRGNRPWDRIAELGFVAAVTNLSSSANTMKALYRRKGEAALRGKDSIPYQLFHGHGWPTPDAVWPAAAATNSKTMAQTGDDVWHVLPAWVSGWGANGWSTAYLNGGDTIVYHGTNTWGRQTNWPNGLDAFQIEVNYTKESGIAQDRSRSLQLDTPFTTDLMDDLIDAILHSLAVNYNWTPGEAYNVVVDNGCPGFSTTGPWTESSDQGAWGTPSILTAQAGSTATWIPALAQQGTYEVLVRWTKSTPRTRAAQYTVNYAGGSQTFTMDQNGGQDAKWVSLGEFQFNAGSSGSVVLEYTGTGETAAADATMFRPVSASVGGIVVDNLDANFTTMGEWSESAAAQEYAGSSLCAEADGATATWMPNLPEPGEYMVLAWWTYWKTRAQRAPYVITDADGSHTVRVDQRENAGKWVPLGIYEFDAGTNGNVMLIREAEDGTSTSADAVRFIRVRGKSYLPVAAKNGWPANGF